jgi:alpha,alpha-trehalose phosphorylase
VAGFGGMRDYGGALSFKPRLPEEIPRLAFGLSYRGRWLRVEARPGEASYSLRAGDPLEVTHYGEKITVAADAPVTREIPPLVPGDAPVQPAGRAPARRQRQY